ncbi:MAG: thymidylate kinase [Candidatus Taylorbacteria bacterium]|nr:thymidylate kinase [Candidatus Taylorbacteria bacterium]
MQTAKPKFIAILGGEGSGKTTQVKRLRERFPDAELVITREPGGSPYGEVIRNIILKHEHSGQASGYTQFGLFWAARHDHMKNIVIPALERGSHVVTDRFDCCSYAYQIFGQETGTLKDLFWQVRNVFLGDRKPDMYVFFDVTPKVGLARVASRQLQLIDSNHFDERKIDFHERIRAGYRDFLSRIDEPHAIIDADKPLVEVSAEFDKIISDVFSK